MKKMCIDVRMAFHSGIGTYIRNLVPALANFFQLQLICSSDGADRWPFLRQYEVIRTSCPIYSIQEQMILPLLVPACDIFWAPHYNLPLAPLRAKKKMVTIHDLYHVVGPVNFLKRFYARQMVKRVVKQADHIVTVSRFSQEEVVKFTKVSEEKISRIHLGSHRADVFPLNYSLPHRYFLYVGNLAPHKNINRLLSAFDLLRKTFPDLKLILVTQGKALLHEGVLVLNHISDAELPALYSGALALIHPSLYEGFGLTPLEAMGYGCPVVVSNVASLPEVCGEAALYIDPYKVDEIAMAMKQILHNEQLRSNLVEKGLRRSTLFSWEKTVEQHMKVFSS